MVVAMGNQHRSSEAFRRLFQDGKEGFEWLSVRIIWRIFEIRTRVKTENNSRRVHTSCLWTASVLTHFFKGKNLREIKPAMIEQYKAKRIGAGKAQATVNRELSVLSKVFTLAVRPEKADLNPCQSVERFALYNERVRYLTEDEEQRLFQAMGENQQLKDIVTVTLHTACIEEKSLT
jgi:site-specific recombinase XerD